MEREGPEMIDWSFVATLTGGGFGVTILVLAIVTVVVWLIGFLLQKLA